MSRRKRRSGPDNIEIAVDDLEPGLYIRISPKHYLAHPFLRNALLLKTDEQVAALKASEIESVYCDLTKSKIDPQRSLYRQAIIQPEVSPEKIEALWEKKEKLQSKAKDYRDRLNKVKERHSKRITQMNEIRLSILAGAPKEDIRCMIEDLWRSTKPYLQDSLDQELNMSLVNGIGGSPVYDHGANVAVLATILSRAIFDLELGGTMKGILMSAALHDIGYARLSKRLSVWRADMTKSEREAKRKHCEEGESILRVTGVFPEDVMRIVKEHHETPDGEGYFGLTEENIHPYAFVIAICDFYDRLVNNPNHMFRMTPGEALQAMFYRYKKRFKKNYLARFIKIMTPTPVGSYLHLSNDDVAMVLSVYPDEFSDPEVMLFTQGISPEDAVIGRLSEIGTALKPKHILKLNQLTSEQRVFFDMGDSVSYRLFR